MSEEMSVVPAVAEGAKAVTKFSAEHGREVGLPSPEAINFMMSVSNLLTQSALITPDMGNTPEQVKANAMAKMLVAHEMGIPALQGLQDIDIVKGKIFVRYPQLIAQMMKRGLKLEWIERSNERAALKVTPPEGAFMMEETFEFTIEDAKLAGLTSPTRSGEPSQYAKRPRVMLSARVVSEAFRMTGGRSGVYTPEEKQEVVDSIGGDGSSQAFAEHTKKTNPYPVGETVIDVPATKPEPAPVQVSVDGAPAVDVKPGEPVPGAQTVMFTAPVAEPKPAPVAAPAPEPVAVKPAAAPSPASKTPTAAALTERMKVLTDLVPKTNPTVAQQKFALWMKAFLGGVKDLPKASAAAPQYDVMLRILDATLRVNSPSVLTTATLLGDACGKGYLEFLKTIKDWGWSERCQLLAFDVAMFFGYPVSGGTDSTTWAADFREYIEGQGLDGTDVPELELFTFLSVARRTRDVHKLTDVSIDTETMMSEIVSRWGIDIDTAPVAGIEALLEGELKKSKDKTATEVAEKVQVADSDVVSDLNEIADLFADQ